LKLSSAPIVQNTCLLPYFTFKYAKTPNAALFGQLITAPITICLTAVCGILITSATAEIYGEYVWNPFELLLTIQQQQPLTPAARAGTFFAGLGFLCSQLALCIVLNCVSAGMDLAALCPKWINIRRGGYFLSIVAVAICPWNYVTKPTTFITVLSGWSVFLSPMTGIVVSDYFLVRGRNYHQGDLYTANNSSAYWYYYGFNWRGFAAWIIGTFPTLPGFARSIKGVSSDNGWDHIYQITYLYGFCSALLVYWAGHTIFLTPHQTGHSPFMLKEHARSSSASMDHGKAEPLDVCNETCNA
jgi:NCS1 family nucleobase:cation symporter-1